MATLPAPVGYVQTCKLDSEWCIGAQSGRIPSRLRRPLHLPSASAGSCPVGPRARYDNGSFGGVVLGRGPVRPIVAAPIAQGSVTFRASQSSPGWYDAKTLWFSAARYRGPVLIRGRKLDGPGLLGFGSGEPRLVDPQFAPAAGNVIRQWPGATWITAPGCYAWQIDGVNFSTVVVFRARLSAAA
jgi:hypothetical protein